MPKEKTDEEIMEEIEKEYEDELTYEQECSIIERDTYAG